MSWLSSSSDCCPTLKSPSVARITRLVPPFINVLLANLYAARIPASPGVAPPASSWQMDSSIFFFSEPQVGVSHTPFTPPYTTIETVSTWRRLFIIRLKADFSRGKRLGRSMDPETSIRNTRLAGGILSSTAFLAQMFKYNNSCSVFQGQDE